MSLRAWRLGDRKTERVLKLVLVVQAMLFGLSFGVDAFHFIVGDFFAMWTFGRFALTHPAILIYDRDALHAFQLLYDPLQPGFLPFPYPPLTIVMLLPVGLLPITLAWAVWSAAGLAAYLLAGFAPRLKDHAILFVALAPTTIMALISGQNGLFSSALMIGGVRLMRARPAIAGVLFGLLSFKPQIALLVPIALLAARSWRCIAAACLTLIGLVTVTTLAFGGSIWGAWIATLGQHWSGYVADRTLVGSKMPTITANLELLGVAAGWAQATQGVVSVLAAGLVWRCFRRRVDVWSAACLVVGNFVATPYALFYDLPSMTMAILFVLRDMARRDAPWSLLEALILLAAYLMPLAQFVPDAIPAPASCAALVLLFGVLVRRTLQVRSKAREEVLF